MAPDPRFLISKHKPSRNAPLALKQAATCLSRRDWPGAIAAAEAVLARDRQSYAAWRVLAAAQEGAGDWLAAFSAYEAALALRPEGLDLILPLAQLAVRLGHLDAAAGLFTARLNHDPEDVAALDGLARTWRKLGRLDEASAVLQAALTRRPETALLWDTLGLVTAARGDLDTALIFHNEALRLQEDLDARYNRGCVLTALGRFDDGLPDLEAVLGRFDDPDARAAVALACAQARLGTGDLAGGWPLYLQSREKPGGREAVHYDLPPPRLAPDQMAGRRVLFCAEQGLGDEILFASLLPDALPRLGAACVTLAVEPRLISLFARSFPETSVIAHRTWTEGGRIQRTFDGLPPDLDGYGLFGDLLGVYRRALSDFPAESGYLKPDPARTADWRTWLASLGPGPAIGVLWKSGLSDAERNRRFAPLTAWREALALAGATFVTLQYGDCAADLQQAAAMGLRLVTPPDLDLRRDLEGVAALCAALDAVAGPSNATTNLAAALGAPVYLLEQTRSWIFLGQDRHPFYPSVRPIRSEAQTDHAARLTALAEALRRDFGLG